MPKALNSIRISTPPWLEVDYHYSRPGQEPLHLTWHGNRTPEILQSLRTEAGEPIPFNSGQCFIGSKGILVSDYGKHLLLPEDTFKDIPAPEPFIENSIGHHKEWTEAIKQGGSTTCHFDYGAALTEAVLLGSVSYRSAGKLLTTWRNQPTQLAPEKLATCSTRNTDVVGFSETSSGNIPSGTFALCWLNGQTVPSSSASISIFDRGFAYGDGVFETLRLEGGQPLFWTGHWERMNAGGCDGPAPHGVRVDLGGSHTETGSGQPYQGGHYPTANLPRHRRPWLRTPHRAILNPFDHSSSCARVGPAETQVMATIGLQHPHAVRAPQRIDENLQQVDANSGQAGGPPTWAG